jgi:hypothetical protein
VTANFAHGGLGSPKRDFYGGAIFCTNHSCPLLQNLHVTHNIAKRDYHGGGLFCEDTSDVTIINSVFHKNWADYGGGMAFVHSSPVLKHVTVSENRGERGGGLYFKHSGGELYDVQVTGNTAKESYGGIGAGIYCWDSDPVMTRILIKDNISKRVRDFTTGHGGGLYLYRRSDVLINDSYIINNSASMYGGGIYASLSSPRLSNVVIQKNKAYYTGGGVYIAYTEKTLQPFFENVRIVNNVARKGGGGFCYWPRTPQSVFKNVTICHNRSHTGVGGLSTNTNLLLDAESNCSIYLNKAFQGAADLDTGEGTDVFLDTLTVSHPTNHQIKPAGRINLHYNHALFNNTAEKDLYVSQEGSNDNSGTTPEEPIKSLNLALLAVSADSAHPRTIHVAPGIYSPSTTGERFPLFGRNYISVIGEKAETTILDAEETARVFMFSRPQRSVLANLTLQHGYANVSAGMGVLGKAGGGLYSYLGGDFLLKNLIVRHNRAEWYGGGIALSSSRRAELQNVLIHHNELDTSRGEWPEGGGAGLYVSKRVVLKSVTVVDNQVRSPGSDAGAGGLFVGGRYPIDHSNSTLLNSLIHNNSPRNVGLANSYNTLTVIHSNIQSGKSGIHQPEKSHVNWLEGNIDADPRFLGGEPFDYRLTRHSPCIDSGTPFYVWKEDTLIDLTPDQYLASAPDMGAFEFDPDTRVESNNKQPAQFRLEQNYPNPFNPTTTIRYALPEACHVKLTIMDILGRTVAVLIDEQQRAGRHDILWDGKDENGSMVASGVYVYTLTAGDSKERKKLLLVR